jgi:hypothetical protein
MHSLGHRPDKPWLDMEGSWQSRYRAGEAHRPKIHLAASPVGEILSCEQERHRRGRLKTYLDFFDLGPPLRFTKTTKKFSDGSTPRLFGLTINQCHIHLTVLCDKVLWIPCPLKLDMSDDDGDSA